MRLLHNVNTKEYIMVSPEHWLLSNYAHAAIVIVLALAVGAGSMLWRVVKERLDHGARRRGGTHDSNA
ncbi:hypothetical protein [Ramlibacter sp.]|uniref:hypothetical protein n=1 Tax=Ramlibacter sp. TaxID=1917967 RepID=UPI00183288F2|nr:hypothetical protein [Ramlibacter sp.]MBA2672379.1 hypothetical protein [Ramlibacter sp.]